jgi:threonine synthase
MAKYVGYRCHRCGREYPPAEIFYTCPEDGANLDVLLDVERIRAETSPVTIAGSRDESIWRYVPLLPVGDPGFIGTPLRAVGWTPLFSPDRLSEALGLAHLWLKDDGRNPTASFKDRASAVVVARAREIGAETVATASTGNAGAALAGMAAAVGQPAVILAPKSAPPAKIAQLLIFGAHVILVDGSYDQAFDLTLQASAELGWYCRNTGYNPFTAEGKKTAAYEICEQLTVRLGPANGKQDRWRSPDAVFVSVGDGNIITGLHKGFSDLMALGWIDRTPRLFGVQSEGSAAIYNAFKAGVDTIEPVRADTIADSISVDLPRDGARALRAVRETGGEYLTVTDDEILAAIAGLGREAAVFAEPAGAAGYAGLAKAVAGGLVESGEQVVCLVTGNGLKDVRAGMQAAGQAAVIEPSIDALRREMTRAEAVRHGS